MTRAITYVLVCFSICAVFHYRSEISSDYRVFQYFRSIQCGLPNWFCTINVFKNHLTESFCFTSTETSLNRYMTHVAVQVPNPFGALSQREDQQRHGRLSRLSSITHPWSRWPTRCWRLRSWSPARWAPCPWTGSCPALRLRVTLVTGGSLSRPLLSWLRHGRRPRSRHVSQSRRRPRQPNWPARSRRRRAIRRGEPTRQSAAPASTAIALIGWQVAMFVLPPRMIGQSYGVAGWVAAIAVCLIEMRQKLPLPLLALERVNGAAQMGRGDGKLNSAQTPGPPLRLPKNKCYHKGSRYRLAGIWQRSYPPLWL